MIEYRGGGGSKSTSTDIQYMRFLMGPLTFVSVRDQYWQPGSIS